MKIKQRHEEGHFETIIDININDRMVGYGHTQDEADEQAIKLLVQYYENQ